MAVHDPAEFGAAIRAKADLVFLSPVFATRSHPDAGPLGRIRFGLLARSAPMPVIALGGMTSSNWRSLKRQGAYGYAAIDDWLKCTSPVISLVANGPEAEAGPDVNSPRNEIGRETIR